MVAKLDWEGNWKGPRNLGTCTLGTAWKDIGSAVRVGGAKQATTFLSVHIHNGTNARFRLVGRYEANGSDFGLGSYEAGTGAMVVNDKYYELGQDADQDVALHWLLFGSVPYIKLQGQVAAGTATYISNARLITSI